MSSALPGSGGVPVTPAGDAGAGGSRSRSRSNPGLPGEVTPDLPGYAPAGRGEPGQGRSSGITTFQGNLVRPSSLVGLHPQLVEYDVSRADGAQVGINKNSL